MKDTRKTVGDLLDHPTLGPELLDQVARDSHESDLVILSLYQEAALRGGPPPPKSLWRRITKYRAGQR